MVGALGGNPQGDPACAKKLGKGGSDVRSITETFRRNPAGNQSRLVEPGPQPEASLAWGGEIRTAKRRQRVLMPCDGAPKLPLVESPRGTLCVGPCRPTAMALPRVPDGHLPSLPRVPAVQVPLLQRYYEDVRLPVSLSPRFVAFAWRYQAARLSFRSRRSRTLNRGPGVRNPVPNSGK